jgi:ribonuclease G
VFSPSFEAIHVNDPEVYTQISNYVSLIAPERKDIVKLYSKPEPIFDTFAVTRQIKSSFGKTVSFKSGAYIIIEHTEALHVIDVNSGNRTKATNDQETNALEVNLRAADEIARQLRLRDMGGIIVIDFIDMNKNEHRQQLYEHMREVMANDRARHNILPLSKFGLMQITRQRVRPALDITTTETCPSCFGKGVVQPSLLFTDTLFEKIEYVVNELGKSGFNVYVHPFVEAYLKKGWLLSLAYLQYRVVDSEGNILDLKQEKDTNSSSAEKTNSKIDKRSDADTKTDTKETTEAKQPKQNKNKATKASTTAPVTEASDDTNVQPQEQAQKPRKPRKQRPKKPAKTKSDADPAPETTIALDAPDYTKALPAHTEEPQQENPQNSDIQPAQPAS